MISSASLIDCHSTMCARTIFVSIIYWLATMLAPQTFLKKVFLIIPHNHFSLVEKTRRNEVKDESL
jgi:hypothetical protein